MTAVGRPGRGVELAGEGARGGEGAAGKDDPEGPAVLGVGVPDGEDIVAVVRDGEAPSRFVRVPPQVGEVVGMVRGRAAEGLACHALGGSRAGDGVGHRRGGFVGAEVELRGADGGGRDAAREEGIAVSGPRGPIERAAERLAVGGEGAIGHHHPEGTPVGVVDVPDAEELVVMVGEREAPARLVLVPPVVGIVRCVRRRGRDDEGREGPREEPFHCCSPLGSSPRPRGNFDATKPSGCFPLSFQMRA